MLQRKPDFLRFDRRQMTVLEARLPEPALDMTRCHSFCAWHREGEYGHLLDEHDRRMLS
ncbi:MAG TPA: inositol oxygenase family protein [Planctomycetaceae bacterium]|nr:inositol oxygenase family protein [Planctomycetaceae bacterium]